VLRNRQRTAETWDDGRAGRGRIGLAVGGGALVLGALLPWASVSAPNAESFTLNSMDRASDGWLTMTVGVIVVGVALMKPGRGPFAIAGLAGLFALVSARENWVNLRAIVDHAENTSPAPVSGEIGLGLWLTVFAALTIVGIAGWFLAADWNTSRRRRRVVDAGAPVRRSIRGW
jgi:hypothetical protein